jgi:hypothetical protein
VFAFVSKSEADFRTPREVAGLMSQSVVSFGDIPEARRAISWHDPKIVVCEARVRDRGDWQELLEEAGSCW